MCECLQSTQMNLYVGVFADTAALYRDECALCYCGVGLFGQGKDVNIYYYFYGDYICECAGNCFATYLNRKYYIILG